MEGILTIEIIKIKTKTKKVKKWLLKIKKPRKKIWCACSERIKKNSIAERAVRKEGGGIFDLFISFLLIFPDNLFL